MTKSFKTRARRAANRKALFLGTALAALPTFGFAQTILPDGPGVETGPNYLMNGADAPVPGQSTNVAPYNATQSGAIQALAYDPYNAQILLAASPNGGIFRSTNGGQSWTATTDNQASLSVASLNFDTTDTSGKTVVAGVGLISSGATFSFNPYFNQSRGGVLDGLMISKDAGATWTQLAGAGLPQISYEAVAVRGSTILAAAFNEVGAWTSSAGVESASGLYRSTDGGSSFTKVTTGLPAGAASALVGDPSNPNRFYVAITTASAGFNNDGGTSVYTTTDGGATWTKVFDASNAGGKIAAGDPTALRLAAGPNGSVAIAVVDGPTGTVTGMFLSKDQGATWHDLSIALTPGSPNGSGQQFQGGEGGGTPAPIPTKGTPGSTWAHVVADEGIPDQAINPGGQATLHSVISIDPNNPNVVYVAGDRQDLPSIDGATSYSGNALRAVLNPDGTVTYAALTDNFTGDHSTYHPDTRAMAFDANGDLVVGSDGGVYTRSSPQTSAGVWRGLNVGRQALEIYDLSLDPHSGLIAVSAQDNGSAIQSPTNRLVYNQINGGDGTVAQINGVTDPHSSWTYFACQYFCGGPSRIQTDVHGNFTGANVVDLYYSVDGTNPDGIIGINSSNVVFTPKLKLNNIDPSYQALGVQPGIILAYDNVLAPTLTYAGTPLFGYNGPGSYVILPLNFAGYTGFNQALDFGTRDNEFALLAGGSSYGGRRLFVSTAPDYADVRLLPVTSYTGFAPTAVLFDPRSQNRFFATDTNILYGTVDGGATGTNLASNLPYGFFRPQSLAFVSNNGVNELLVGGLNYAANVGSPLVVADSDANGVLSNWRRFGTGLPNADVTVLDYVPSLDALAIGTFGRGAFILYDVTSNFSTATVLQFGLANNDSNPAVSLLSGARPLIKYGTGTLTINGQATYTGGTEVTAGNLVLNGSILNNALIDTGAYLYGAGSVTGKLTVNGTVVPGGLGSGTLTVGSFAAGPGSVLAITYAGATSTSITSLGAANITGMTLQVTPVGNAGASFFQRYTVLTSSALTGQFTNSAGFHTDGALLERIRYDVVTNGVALDVVHPIDFGQNAKTANQRAVAGALNANELTGSDSFLSALNGIYNGGSPASASLAALSGEGGVNTTNAARVVSDRFLSVIGNHIGGGGSADASSLRLAQNTLTAPTVSGLAISDVADAAVASAAGSSEVKTRSVWGEAFVVSDRLTGDNADVKSSASGFAAGYEQAIGAHAKIGYALGYAQGKANTDALSTSSKGDYLNASVYASRKLGPWFVGGIAAYNSGRITENRTLALVGGPTLFANGSTTQSDFQASILGGRNWTLGQRTHLTASGSFTVNDQAQRGYTENGAGGFSLHYDEIKRVSYQTEVGLKLDHSFKTPHGVIDPYIGASTVFLTGERANSSVVDFTGAASSTFRIQGDSLPTNWTKGKAGVKWDINRQVKLDFQYQGAFGGHLKQDAAMLNVSFAW